MTGTYEAIALLATLGWMFIGIAIVMAVGIAIRKSNRSRGAETSYYYRKTQMNLYVAGKIRNLAKTDGVDIEEEYKKFIKDSENDKRIYATNQKKKQLDEAIEEEIQKKIEEKKE